jgi:hypothetical protein
VGVGVGVGVGSTGASSPRIDAVCCDGAVTTRPDGATAGVVAEVVAGRRRAPLGSIGGSRGPCAARMGPDDDVIDDR